MPQGIFLLSFLLEYEPRMEVTDCGPLAFQLCKFLDLKGSQSATTVVVGVGVVVTVFEKFKKIITKKLIN